MGKEEFKEFVKTKPELVDYIEDNTMTWQKFYELYDMFGEDEAVWSKYGKRSTKKVSDYFTSLNLDNVEEHLKTAEMALGFITELTQKSDVPTSGNVAEAVNRPIGKFFGD